MERRGLKTNMKTKVRVTGKALRVRLETGIIHVVAVAGVWVLTPSFAWDVESGATRKAQS